MIISLLKIDIKNLNDRIYSTESVQKMIEDFNQKKKNHVILTHNSDEPIIETPSIRHFEIDDLFIKDNTLFGNIKFEEIGKYLEEPLSKGNIVIRPRCLGEVNKNGEVEIKELISFGVVSKFEDSFKNIL